MMEGFAPTEEMLDAMMGEGGEEPLSEMEQRRILTAAMKRIEQERQTAEYGECEVTTQRETVTHGEATTRRGRTRRWRRAVAVACVAAMALSAVAFGSTLLDGGLVEFLGGGSQRGREILSDMGTMLDESQSLGGYTVALKQMVNDRNGCYVLVEVSRDDGQPLEAGYYAFASTDVKVKEVTGGNGSGWYVDQPQETDGTSDTVALVLHFDSTKKLAGKTLELAFHTFGKDGSDLEVLAEETWKFAVEVSNTDQTQTFRLNQPVTFESDEEEKTVTVETLYLSPISVMMEVGQNLRSTDMRELAVLLKDGSWVEFSGGGYGSGFGLTGSYTQVDFRFNTVVDPQEIEEIWFNGTKLEWR